MTMHPQAKNKANISGMAVTATLVFSDEGHRESWLRRMGVIEGTDADFIADYENRKRAQDLVYIVGAIGPGDFDQEKNATGTTCDYAAHYGHPCGAPQYDVRGRIECRSNHWEDPEPCSVSIHGSPCGTRRYRSPRDRNIIMCHKGHREVVSCGT